MERLVELTQRTAGDVLLAFDFPFGYPFNSGLGGGRQAGRTLSSLLEDNDNDSNNRFEAANELNAVLSELPGPFWGHPKSQDHEHLSWNKPTFLHPGFDEWRIVEKRLKSRNYKIMNVWQLLGQGSVGSQTMTGLARLFDFSQDQRITQPIRFWPFETNWERDLDGIVLAEIWPSLNDHSAIDHPIKDARQVSACLDWLVALNGGENLLDIFKPPSALSLKGQEKCRTEEGWILGVR